MGRYDHLYLEPGALVAGRYRIVERVARSGDDVDPDAVYLARDEQSSDRPRAVKQLHALFAGERERAAAAEGFVREARRLAALGHPALPAFVDAVVEPMHFYLVTSYVRGRDLEEEASLRGGLVDEATVTRWAVQACDALAYLHGQDPPFVVRDLEPAHMMLEEGRIVFVNFGLGRFAKSGRKSPHGIAKMGYATPESFAGRFEPRSDVYSLGATMFHLLTGSDPRDNPLLVFNFEKYPRPRQINPAITIEMDEIVGEMVAHKMEARPTATEVKRALEEHGRGLDR